MEIWNRFTAWLSGWPEPRAKEVREEDFLFVEEEKLKKNPKKPKGLKPKKKKVKKQ